MWKKVLICLTMISLLSLSACSSNTHPESDDYNDVSTAIESNVVSSEAPDTDSSESTSSGNIVISMPDISVPDTTISLPNISTSSNTSSMINTDSDVEREPDVPNDPDVKTVGEDDIGYIDVPSWFVTFKDVETNTDLQYSDKSGVNIFTMNSAKHLGMDNLDVDTLAQASAQKMKEDGGQNITGATVKVANEYDAKQIYGYWPDEDMFVVTDIFEADNNIVFLTVEFTSDYRSLVNYLDTYRPCI